MKKERTKKSRKRKEEEKYGKRDGNEEGKKIKIRERKM